MRLKTWNILVALLLSAASVKAQWDVQFSDYTTLKSFYNPAVSGTDGLLNVAGTFSAQMVGYKGAPTTVFAAADAPIYFLTPRHGAGLSFMTDKIGMFSTTKIGLQYAFNFKLGKRTRLAVGLQGALLSESINPSDVELIDDNDPAFPSSTVSGNRFDMGACNIKIKNTLFSLAPSFLVQTDMQSWREDIQCKFCMDYDGKVLYAGFGYSPSISTTFLIGGSFHGIRLGYSYQMYTSGVGAKNGAHEVVVNYQVDLDLFKKGRNAHKSVRWL